jgi:hypothetical protein
MFGLKLAYMNAIAAALWKVDRLDSASWIQTPSLSQEVQGILLLNEGADLHPKESHIGGSPLKSDDAQFDPVCSTADHSESLGAGH